MNGSKTRALKEGGQGVIDYSQEENLGVQTGGTAQLLTRDCLDPWNYLEISAAGDLRPCCNFHPLAQLGNEGNNIAALRNNDKFRSLRASLLSGNLEAPCQRCHIRKTVPVDVLKRRLRRAWLPRGLTTALEPLPITSIRIDINETCNLRCDYCAVSSPGYRGIEMSGTTFAKVAKLFDVVRPDATIHVNGHGETTYHPNWMQMSRAIIDFGYRPLIITNLAKNYSDEEIDMLSTLYVIEVSLDSDDTDLMKRIRKAVRVDNVFKSLQRIREAAHQHGRFSPLISFSVGIYEPSIWTLERFVDRLIEFGIQRVTFWDLVEMPHQRLAKPLRQLDEQSLIRARKILSNVRHKLEMAGVHYAFTGDLDLIASQASVAVQWWGKLGRAWTWKSRSYLIIFMQVLRVLRYRIFTKVRQKLTAA